MRSPVVALLGPTNTGKTYLAVERMLAHRSGMIGFPLRLLVRENYDRVARLKGIDQVALITGEEKILPKHPAYFMCTVEAMPLDRSVEFLAVDEIQLAAERHGPLHHFVTKCVETLVATEEDDIPDGEVPPARERPEIRPFIPKHVVLHGQDEHLSIVQGAIPLLAIAGHTDGRGEHVLRRGEAPFELLCQGPVTTTHLR